MKLYTFFRSSAAYRVRIALNLKGIKPEMASIVFSKREQFSPEYRAINPQMRVPTLTLDSGDVLVQSLAIIDYLDEVHPQPALLPSDPIMRARARMIAQAIACDIHPLNNLAPLNYLKKHFKADEDAINAWYHHWVLAGFEAIEIFLEAAPYCIGNQVTVADICLIPQIYNARRYNVPLDTFPKILSVEAACNKLPAFEEAKPENQFDAT